MAKQKLVLINDVEPYQAIGGQASFLRNLLPYLHENFEIELMYLPDAWVRRKQIPRRLQLLVYTFLQRSRLRKASIVFSQTPEASWMASFFVPEKVFHIFHGNTNPLTTSKYWYGRYFRWVFNAFNKRIIAKARQCYTVGEDRDHCRFLFQPIDLRYLNRVAAVQASKPFFLFVGRVEEVKQVHRIIQAFELFCTQHGATHELVICGEGILLETCKVQAAGSPYSALIRFTGKQSYEEVIGYMRSATALVMASLYEGFPMVIAEAFCCRLPVISTTVGAVAKVVQANRNGILLPVDFTIQAYADALHVIRENQVRFADAAFESAQVFNAEHLVNTILTPDFTQTARQSKPE